MKLDSKLWTVAVSKAHKCGNPNNPCEFLCHALIDLFSNRHRSCKNSALQQGACTASKHFRRHHSTSC